MPARVPSGVPYVFVTRGEAVESVHCVAACAASDEGDVSLALGEVEVPIFLRSAWKPFIAADVVACGAAAHFGFERRELAVIAASHNGEPLHVAAVRGILAKIGLDERALQCGAHAPSYEPAARALREAGGAPSALHNNCSGKHAGVLASCVRAGIDPATYLSPENSVQQRIAAFCARLAGDELAEMPRGVDGCGFPVYATSLAKAALAFARLRSLRGIDPADAAALGVVRDAMLAEPAYVAGTARLDTALMETTRGRIVCKAGAEGVHASGLERLGVGYGLVLKVVDGNRRAAPPAAVALLSAAGWLSAMEKRALATFARADVRNVAGAVVGSIAARSDDTIVRNGAS
ncbi:MAG: asparaginase [Candidatus Eremiobacteraeota bacterium]|nr:asparaginase [Candidatus Eremiobacteraeota bacterium]